MVDQKSADEENAVGSYSVDLCPPSQIDFPMSDTLLEGWFCNITMVSLNRACRVGNMLGYFIRG